MTCPTRVRRYTSRAPRGSSYSGHILGYFQELQEKRWWGWKTIDTEEIPQHVVISLKTLGDTGGWVSKFAKAGA